VALGEGSPPSAVYTFGMPRVGGERFEASYDAGLGALTYRLVHGIDLVARVPPLPFRHVGRVLQSDAEAKFDEARPLSPIGSDDPPFDEELPTCSGAAWAMFCLGVFCRQPDRARSVHSFDLFHLKSGTICRIPTGKP